MPRVLALLPFIALLALSQSNNRGWYRSPALHGDTIAFTAEGDLWLVSIDGGLAHRLTTNPGNETSAAFSPDGSSITFSADYEGPTEICTMPANGG
jgi:tricorn protease